MILALPFSFSEAITFWNPLKLLAVEPVSSDGSPHHDVNDSVNKRNLLHATDLSANTVMCVIIIIIMYIIIIATLFSVNSLVCSLFGSRRFNDRAFAAVIDGRPIFVIRAQVEVTIRTFRANTTRKSYIIWRALLFLYYIIMFLVVAVMCAVVGIILWYRYTALTFNEVYIYFIYVSGI